MRRSLDIFAPLLGCSVFDAKKGYGSFVTFSLTRTPDAPTEEFYFWVYLCDWEIREPGRELAHSESEVDELISAVSALNGKRLERLNFHQWLSREGVLHGVSLVFEPGLYMKLYQYRDSSPDDEIFLMKSAAGEWTSYMSNGGIETEREE